MGGIMAHIKENTHWYDLEGNPAYTVKDKKGNERPTNLRDARKEGYVPSVTTIMGEANKPGLNNWIAEQNILSAITLPRIDGETDSELMARIKEDAREQARAAAEKGTQIHAWIQQGFEGGLLEEEAYEYYIVAKETLDKECDLQEWMPEQSFCYKDHGGKVDLPCPHYIIDIKTKESEKKFGVFDEHFMQLATYRRGLNYLQAECGILFVSYDFKCKLILIPEDKLIRGLKMFDALKDFWYAKTGLERS